MLDSLSSTGRRNDSAVAFPLALTSRARRDRSDPRDHAGCERFRRHAGRGVRSDASPEVSSPSALAGPRRAVRSGHAANDPASAFCRLSSRSACEKTRNRVGVALAVLRSSQTQCGAARRAGHASCFGCASGCRTARHPKGAHASSRNLRSLRAGMRRRNRTRSHSRMIRHIKRHRFRRLLPGLRHAPTRSFAWRSAPPPGPSRPGRTIGISSLPCRIVRRRSWGSLARLGAVPTACAMRRTGFFLLAEPGETAPKRSFLHRP